MIYSGDFELLRTNWENYWDVSCPECGATYAIEAFPDNCALASAAIECEECGTELTLILHNVPTFTVTYRGE